MGTELDKPAALCRSKALDPTGRRVLIAALKGSDQERDFTVPANCGGYGRVRHFHRRSNGWLENPLPMDPACKALGRPKVDMIRAQVFQIAVCNWRCWYCFVPYQLLSGDLRYSAWLSPSDLVDLYLNESDPPLVVDLTGGQPDLVPEWIPWMIREVHSRGLDGTIYLWSDDNLSSDYFWRYLSDEDRSLLATYPYYGRVCCLKGIDPVSFSFNTGAPTELYDQQLKLVERLLDVGLDLYAYVTLTGPVDQPVQDGLRRFLDRLQELDENLPLRTVPLEIVEFSPVTSRLTPTRAQALRDQRIAADLWRLELENRFSTELRCLSIADVPLRQRQRIAGHVRERAQ